MLSGRIGFTEKQKRTFELPERMAEEGKRIAVVDGPFQCGKTYALAYAFVNLITSYPDPTADFAVAAQSNGLVKNTLFKNLRVACDYMDYPFTQFSEWRGYGEVAGRRVYGFAGHDSNSADKVRGISLAGVWVDEVTKCNQEFVLEMLGRASLDNARIFLSTNPGGPQHWLKTDYIDDLDSKNAIRIRYEMADNPNVSPAYLKDLNVSYSGAMKARYRYGEWAAAEGFIYPDFQPVEPREWESPIEYDLAIDAGYASVTHCLLIGGMDDGRKWVLDEFRYDAKKGGAMSPGAICLDIRDRLQGRTVSRVVVDDAATSMKTSIREVFGIRPMAALKTSKKGVVPGIHFTEYLLNTGKLNVHPRCKETIREMSNYQWKPGAEDEPLKVDDHACDALRYYAVRMKEPEELVRRIG